MREYKRRTVQEVVACTCDRCKRRLTADEPGEWQERLSFDQGCGFESVFGDGSTISLDLCQHCVQQVLGEWLRITPTSTARPALYPGVLEKFARFGADFMAAGCGEHEQAVRAGGQRRKRQEPGK